MSNVEQGTENVQGSRGGDIPLGQRFEARHAVVAIERERPGDAALAHEGKAHRVRGLSRARHSGNRRAAQARVNSRLGLSVN
jgi:hypothetical protein